MNSSLRTTINELSHKIIILGDAFVGKTCILLRLTRNVMCDDVKPTIGVAYVKHTIELADGKKKVLDLWDTTGDERYRSVLPSFYRKASVAIIVFDVTNWESFRNLDYWISMTRSQCGDNARIILVGAKCDCENLVRNEEAQIYAESQGLDLFYCSAKTGQNINNIFLAVAEMIPEVTQQVEDTSDPIVLESSSCCDLF